MLPAFKKYNNITNQQIIISIEDGIKNWKYEMYKMEKGFNGSYEPSGFTVAGKAKKEADDSNYGGRAVSASSMLVIPRRSNDEASTYQANMARHADPSRFARRLHYALDASLSLDALETYQLCRISTTIDKDNNSRNNSRNNINNNDKKEIINNNKKQRIRCNAHNRRVL